MNKKNTDNSYFCSAPWTTTCIDPEGAVVPCSIYRKEFENNDFDQPLHKNLLNSTFEEAFNSSTMKNLRKEMMSNKRPSGCSSCHAMKRTGEWTYKQFMLDNFEAQDALKNYNTNTGEITNPSIEFIDMSLTNRCNLKCRMCAPTFSSGLTKEMNKFNNISYKGDNHISLQIPQEHLFNPNLKLLKLQGGEPLLDKNLIDTLSLLIEHEIAPNLELHIFTNLTLITIKHLELLSHFKKVDLFCSTDGWGSVNEYIRYPSKWTQLYKKIELVNIFSKDHPNIKLGINTVIQIYNIYHMPDFIKNLWDKFNITAHFQLLYSPSYLSIKILPLDEKLRIKKIFEHFLSNEDYSASSSYLSTTLTHMMEEDLSHLSKEFIRFTHFFDKSREQKILNACPELKFFFND